jgi:hypothetical protein
MHCPYGSLKLSADADSVLHASHPVFSKTSQPLPILTAYFTGMPAFQKHRTGYELAINA